MNRAKADKTEAPGLATATTEQPAIPGLDVDREEGMSTVEAAVRDSIRALHAAGRIRPEDAGKVAVAVELAQVMVRKRASGRASTVANDARLLTEILDSFVAEDQEADARLIAAMEEWSREEAGG